MTDLAAQPDHDDDKQHAPDSLMDQDLLAQLRTANENLVLATIEAQTMQERAEAANLRQNEFLAMLAHELRNPLAPISTAAAMLERVAATDPLLSKVQTIISRQIDHMARLLDDLLDASRVSTGKVSLQRRPVRFADIISRALEVSQPLLDKRHQHLVVQMPDEEVGIDGDLVRLAQVFSNLLINASKFTPVEGRIELCAQVQGDQIVAVVRDNGVGIAPDVMPHIFDLFMQGARALDRADGGLGIGLTVARSLVEGHGGSIIGHSAGPGLGSEFTVALPVYRAWSAEESGIAAATSAPSSRRILLVEDNVDANETLKMLLELEGHEVHSAYDGLAGLALSTEHAFDVIICDIGLPGLDGLEFVRRVRGAESRVQPFIIATSGYGQADDRLRALDAGFSDYLVKPVASAQILKLIAAQGASSVPTVAE